MPVKLCKLLGYKCNHAIDRRDDLVRHFRIVHGATEVLQFSHLSVDLDVDVVSLTSEVLAPPTIIHLKGRKETIILVVASLERNRNTRSISLQTMTFSNKTDPDNSQNNIFYRIKGEVHPETQVTWKAQVSNLQSADLFLKCINFQIPLECLKIPSLVQNAKLQISIGAPSGEWKFQKHSEKEHIIIQSTPRVEIAISQVAKSPQEFASEKWKPEARVRGHSPVAGGARCLWGSLLEVGIECLFHVATHS